MVSVVTALCFDGEEFLVGERFFDGEGFLVLRVVIGVGVDGVGVGESMSSSEGGSRILLRLGLPLPGGVLVSPPGAIAEFCAWVASVQRVPDVAYLRTRSWSVFLGGFGN